MIFFIKTDSGKCFDVSITTKDYGSEISWTIGTCTSAKAYQNSQTYTESCCLDAGSYTLTCDDSYGDGWDGGLFPFSTQASTQSKVVELRELSYYYWKTDFVISGKHILFAPSLPLTQIASSGIFHLSLK